MEQWCFRVAEVEWGAAFAEGIVFIQLYLQFISGLPGLLIATCNHES